MHRLAGNIYFQTISSSTTLEHSRKLFETIATIGNKSLIIQIYSAPSRLLSVSFSRPSITILFLQLKKKKKQKNKNGLSTDGNIHVTFRLERTPIAASTKIKITTSAGYFLLARLFEIAADNRGWCKLASVSRQRPPSWFHCSWLLRIFASSAWFL